jgi:hypothetical protein
MATKRGEGTYQICPDGNLRLGHIKDAWPWLNDSGLLEAIWKRFDNQVVCGGMTLEALVDYVRSIEPDCGGCNRFDCTCKRAGAESTASEQVSVTA